MKKRATLLSHQQRTPVHDEKIECSRQGGGAAEAIIPA